MVNIRACDKLKMSGSAKYDIAELFDAIYPDEEASYYEALMGSVVPYYDYEVSFDEEKQMIDARESHFEQCKEKLKKLFPYGNILCLDACGKSKDKYKISFHFIVRRVGMYASGSDLIARNLVPEGFDKSVYKAKGKRQLFRLPYCTKEGEARCLRVIDTPHHDPKILDIDEFDKKYGLAELYNYCVSFKGNEPLNEPLVPAKKTRKKLIATEDAPNIDQLRRVVLGLKQARADDRELWIKVVFALGNTTRKYGIDLLPIALEFSKRSIKYESDWDVEKTFNDTVCSGDQIGYGSLVTWLKEDNPSMHANIFINKIVNVLNNTLELANVLFPPSPPLPPTSDVVKHDDCGIDESLMKPINMNALGAMFSTDSVEANLDAAMPIAKHDASLYKNPGEWQFCDWGYFYDNKEKVRVVELMQYMLESIIHVVNKGADLIFSKNILPDDTIEYFSIKHPFNGPGDFPVQLDSGRVELMSTIYLQHYMKHKYNFIDFIPYLETNPAPHGMFNMFPGFKRKFRKVGEQEMKEITTRIAPILEHFKIIGADQCDILLDFIADIVQNPARKPGLCFVIKSAQGAGKNILLEFVMRVIGNGMCNMFTEIQQMTNKFNTRLQGKMLNIGNELANYAGHKIADQLKARITDTDLTIEPKGKETFTIRDVSRFILMTNNDFPIRIESGDRRYILIESDNSKCGNTSYFQALATCMSTHEDDFWLFMCNRDISNFNPYKPPPMTAFKRELLMDNISPVIQFMEAIGNDDTNIVHAYPGCNFVDNNMKVSNKALYAVFKDWCGANLPGRSVTGARQFVKDMSKLGIEKTRVQFELGRMHGYEVNRNVLQERMKKLLHDEEFEFTN